MHDLRGRSECRRTIDTSKAEVFTRFDNHKNRIAAEQESDIQDYVYAFLLACHVWPCVNEGNEDRKTRVRTKRMNSMRRPRHCIGNYYEHIAETNPGLNHEKH